MNRNKIEPDVFQRLAEGEKTPLEMIFGEEEYLKLKKFREELKEYEDVI